MAERGTERLTAWGRELHQVHGRLRQALRLARDGLDARTASDVLLRDLLLHCRGFCAALDGHHRAEDRTLFPAVAAAHPRLRPVLRALEQDHSTIRYLLTGLADALERDAGPDDLARHLEGVAAVMENHFRYEERQLTTVLDTLDLPAAPGDALGPL